MQRAVPLSKRLLVGLSLYIVLGFGLAAFVYQQTLRVELQIVRGNGIVRLNEAASRLRLQVDAYRALVNVIAREPQIRQALVFERFDTIAPVLQNFETTYGAWRVDVADRSGRIRASSNAGQVGRFVSGGVLSAGLNNRLGFETAMQEGQRIIRLSRAIKGTGARPLGVVMVSVSVADLEFEWPVSPEPLLFFSAEGITFSSNRPYLLHLSRNEDPEEAELDLHPLPGPEQIWQFVPPQGAPARVLLEELYVPHLNLTAVILLNIDQPRATALLRAVLVLAGALVIGLIAAIIWQQQRRLAFEAQQSAELETRVEARTFELRKAQKELVEASKLAALGRLSAGISHELNQPLAAILNFAENGQKFLERGKPGRAGENLELISGQINRITRIISNLRTFARQEAAPTDLVDFGQVTRSALAICEADIKAAGVQLSTNLPERPVPVLAGRVRLEQVILNLISNALDAMKLLSSKRLSITLSHPATLKITDNGPGIEDPSRVFEPFYTTKELGASKGLGMGLALSHGIIARFGGELSCANIETGAVFTITLPLKGDPDAE